jgi:hypothetical protein
MPMGKIMRDQETEVEVDPYGTHPLNVLEIDIRNLANDIELHKSMSKVPWHRKLLSQKKRTLARLLSIHPDGEHFLYSL